MCFVFVAMVLILNLTIVCYTLWLFIQKDLIIVEFINEEIGVGVAVFIGTVIGVMVAACLLKCISCTYQKMKEAAKELSKGQMP